MNAPIDAPILFVHPHNHARAEAIPVGSVAAVNLLPRIVSGRYAEEVDRRALEAAKVVLLDVHWFLPLAVLEGMLRSIRRVNPLAKIVVGGLTASFYRDAFLEKFDVDHVVSGDVEPSFPTLVRHLLAGDEVPPLPNVWSRGRPPTERVAIDGDAYSELDWLTIDWFPSYRAHVEEYHARYARLGRSWAADSVHPILPLTRGCRRSCSFCYGAYQDRVFGRRARVRTAESVRRDLLRIDADPALHFVSLFMADAGYLPHFAGALAGCALDLDASLFTCGNSDEATIDAIRGAFRGKVEFTIVHANDVAPLRTDPPAAASSARFERLLAHFRKMERTNVAVYVVDRPASGALATAQQEPGGNVIAQEARDWAIRRPDRAALGEGGAAAQLEDVTSASRAFAGARLVRALVPALRRCAIPSPFDLGDLERVATDPTSDAFERAVADLLVRQVMEARVYGFDEVRLEWTLADADADADGERDVAWIAPGRAVEGRCAWRPNLHGFEWEGAIALPRHGAVHVAPLPRVLVRGALALDVGTWTRARVPALAIPAGPAQTLRIGGRASNDAVELWAELGGARVRRTLAASPEEVRAARDAGPSTLTPLLGDHPPAWPSSQWPERIATTLRRRRAALRPWRLEIGEASPTHVEITLRSDEDAGRALHVLAFPRRPAGFLSTRAISVAYRAHVADDAKALDALMPLLAEAESELG